MGAAGADLAHPPSASSASSSAEAAAWPSFRGRGPSAIPHPPAELAQSTRQARRTSSPRARKKVPQALPPGTSRVARRGTCARHRCHFGREGLSNLRVGGGVPLEGQDPRQAARQIHEAPARSLPTTKAMAWVAQCAGSGGGLQGAATLVGALALLAGWTGSVSEKAAGVGSTAGEHAKRAQPLRPDPLVQEWAQQVSNLRPSPCEGDALPLCHAPVRPNPPCLLTTPRKILNNSAGSSTSTPAGPAPAQTPATSSGYPPRALRQTGVARTTFCEAPREWRRSMPPDLCAVNEINAVRHPGAHRHRRSHPGGRRSRAPCA